MGYLGQFFVEAKAFEIRTVVGFNGIRFAEWCRGTIRVVMLGKTSVLWLRTMMEENDKGAEIKYFYHKVRAGNTIFVA